MSVRRLIVLLLPKLALLLVCLSGRAFGAIAFDAASSGVAFQQTSVTVSHTCTGSNLKLFVGSAAYGTSTLTVTGVTYGGSATGWAQVDSEVFAGDEQSSELWAGPCTAGTANIVVTYSGTSASYCIVTATSFTGVHQASSIGTPSSTQNSIDSLSTNVSSAAGEVVVDFVAVNDVGSVTVGADQTQRVQLAQGTVMTAAMSTEAGAGTVTMGWSWTGSHVSTIIAVPVKPAASSSAVPLVSRRRRRG